MIAKRPFPAHHLGYTRNPFGRLTDAEWAAVAVLPDAVRQALPVGCHHLQLLGPRGVGKSSALCRIVAELRQAGRRVAYEYVPPGQHHFKTDLADVEVFCLDEAQRLSWRQRRRLVRWGGAHGRLIFSSHRDLRRWFGWQRPFVISIDLQPLVTEAHWQAVLARRLAAFARPEAPRLALAPDAVRYLHARFGADLRAGEALLYEVWQAAEGVRTLRAEDLQAALRP